MLVRSPFLMKRGRKLPVPLGLLCLTKGVYSKYLYVWGWALLGQPHKPVLLFVYLSIFQHLLSSCCCEDHSYSMLTLMGWEVYKKKDNGILKIKINIVNSRDIQCKASVWQIKPTEIKIVSRHSFLFKVGGCTAKRVTQSNFSRLLAAP